MIESKDFLESYMNGKSPTGFEHYGGQQIWADYMKNISDDVELDNYGTCFAIIEGDGSTEFRVVIEAHADEIAYYVNYIKDDGIIYVRRNGGSDHQIAPSKRVHIHVSDGKVISGVFGWPAIHTRKGKDVAPTLDNIFIDVGAVSKDEVLEMGIEVGNVITYEDKFTTLNNRYYVGKALDNKIGGYIISQVALRVSSDVADRKILPFDLYIVNSVQEEIGLRGAAMIADKLKPDLVIVTDVTHDTSTPMINSEVYGDIRCGKGPVLPVTPPVQNKFRNFVKKIAKDNNISIQQNVSPGSSGTDADSFAYSNGGTPTVLIKSAQRYMHTTNEMVSIDDVENIIDLIYLTLKNITPEIDLKYFKI